MTRERPGLVSGNTVRAENPVPHGPRLTLAAWQREPLLRLRKYLTDQGAWDEEKETRLLEECAEKVEEAVREYEEAPEPDIASMFDYMYAELPHDLAEQKARAIEDSK